MGTDPKGWKELKRLAIFGWDKNSDKHPPNRRAANMPEVEDVYGTPAVEYGRRRRGAIVTGGQCPADISGRSRIATNKRSKASPHTTPLAETTGYTDPSVHTPRACQQVSNLSAPGTDTTTSTFFTFQAAPKTNPCSSKLTPLSSKLSYASETPSSDCLNQRDDTSMLLTKRSTQYQRHSDCESDSDLPLPRLQTTCKPASTPDAIPVDSSKYSPASIGPAPVFNLHPHMAPESPGKATPALSNSSTFFNNAAAPNTKKAPLVGPHSTPRVAPTHAAKPLSYLSPIATATTNTTIPLEPENGPVQVPSSCILAPTVAAIHISASCTADAPVAQPVVPPKSPVETLQTTPTPAPTHLACQADNGRLQALVDAALAGQLDSDDEFDQPTWYHAPVPATVIDPPQKSEVAPDASTLPQPQDDASDRQHIVKKTRFNLEPSEAVAEAGVEAQEGDQLPFFQDVATDHLFVTLSQPGSLQWQQEQHIRALQAANAQPLAQYHECTAQRKAGHLPADTMLMTTDVPYKKRWGF